MNFDWVLKVLRSKHPFSDENFQRLVPLFEQRSYAKNEFVFQPGEVVKETFFVTKGIFRHYFVTAEGKERIIYFSEEGNFAGELMSFLFEKPTDFYFQALEDAELLVLNRENWEIAFTTIPSFSLYQLKLHAQFIYDLKQEMGNAAKITPDEKYRSLLEKNPSLASRLPQYQIATYLGITPETLSRIRKRMQAADLDPDQ